MTAPPPPIFPVPVIVTVAVPAVVLMTPVPAVVISPPFTVSVALVLKVAPVETEISLVTVSALLWVSVPFETERLLLIVFVPPFENVVVPAPALVRL